VTVDCEAAIAQFCAMYQLHQCFAGRSACCQCRSQMCRCRCGGCGRRWPSCGGGCRLPPRSAVRRHCPLATPWRCVAKSEGTKDDRGLCCSRFRDALQAVAHQLVHPARAGITRAPASTLAAEREKCLLGSLHRSRVAQGRRRACRSLLTSVFLNSWQACGTSQAAGLSIPVRINQLDFAVDQYIAIGSPLGLFLALRKVLVSLSSRTEVN